MRPWVPPVVICAMNLLFLAYFGARGGLERLPPIAQFYFGATTFAFPLIIYLILKKRAERD